MVDKNINQMEEWSRKKLLEEYLKYIDYYSPNQMTNEMRRNIVKTIIDYKNANLQVAFSEVTAYLTTVLVIFTILQILLATISSKGINPGLSVIIVIVTFVWFLKVIFFSEKIRKALRENE